MARDPTDPPVQDRSAPAPPAPGRPAGERALPPLITWLLSHRHAAALIVGLGLLVLFLLVHVDEDSVVRYGYVGVFLTTLVATGGLVVPVPYLLAVAVAGTMLNPLVVGLVGGFASALGELTGYMVGYAGAPLVRRGHWQALSERWVRQYGFWGILALSAVPNPLFDVAGIAAGSLAMPLHEFWLACFVGKTIRLAGIAWLASLAPGLR